MKRSVPLVVLALSGLLVGGCALTTANLNIAYDPTKASQSPLATVRPLGVKVADLVDKRPETDKIGYKKNAYGTKMAPIRTTKPVSQIVREALAAEFARNGHQAGREATDIVVSGDVSTFWFDVEVGFWTVEFIGAVAVDLTVANAKTNEVILTRKYQGSYNEKSAGGLEGTWERVMNTALERLVREVSTDANLIRALRLL